MQAQGLKFFAQISKVDDDERMVYGYASTTSLDSQNERVSKLALEKALPDYMRFANIREMHTNSAVGVTESASIDDSGLYIGAKIVDDIAWNKVKAGVYKGFSIGGKCISKINDEITELRLSEISLVDRPANPECIIDIYKADCDMTTIAKVEEREDVEPKEGEDKYGDVKFADAENKKYPIDTEAHVRAAWNYINKEKNAAKYDAKDLETIKDKIVSAWKELIDDKGPPSEAEKAEQIELRKGLFGVSRLAMILNDLRCVRDEFNFEKEFMNDGQEDQSKMPDMLQSILDEMATCLETMVTEETAKLKASNDTEERVDGDTDTSIEMSDKATDVTKAGARHSSADMKKIQAMHDSAIALGAACISDSPASNVGAPMAEIDPAGSDYNGDDVSTKAEEPELKKMHAETHDTIQKLSDENSELKKRVSELENTVLPAKGSTKQVPVSVSKAEDMKGLVEKQAAPMNAVEAIKNAHANGPSFTIGG